MFGGKGDAKGILARFSRSLTRGDKKSKQKLPTESGTITAAGGDEVSDSESDPTVDGMANSFIDASDLQNFDPRGHADITVRGETHDAALDMDFNYDDSESSLGDAKDDGAGQSGEDSKPKASIDVPVKLRNEIEQAKAPLPNVPADSEIPKLAISMLVCGTRGDVQPFIALGIQLQEFGHRVRLATHKDYREFVTKYGLEFYPLGGDPKILSDFVVKHRGVFTVNTKDAMENINQVEDIVFSSYDACTQPDPEDKKKRPFTAQAIIANPPSYGHVHVAEKMKIPCHIFFTMPWTPTRSFPHPLARLKNVRDTRPGSIALRNYLSYLVVNEYTYTGLFAIFNDFREKKLGLEPVRFGSSGATLLDAHDVPFTYCWSPSLIAKPPDWDDHIDISGYFFLNEGSRSNFKPSKELADFLAKGPPPVYLGFGSLMVDDREKLTEKILKAFKETGMRLLMSKGWAELGEGFDLPDTVMLLDDCPHDWLLPQCCAAVHHGGAGTTAASLLAACPTLVIPFFGDQQFWGSAVFRRGVGAKPIPIDSLTVKKLVAALKYMQKPEVKAEAEKVSALIKAENGVKNGMDAFHKHLPLEALRTGKPVDWNLAKPTLGSLLHEVAGGIGDVFWLPVKGAKTEGIKGAVKGVGRGLLNVVARPVKGVGLASYSVWAGIKDIPHERKMCLTLPETKSSKNLVAPPKPSASSATAKNGISSSGSSTTPVAVDQKASNSTEDHETGNLFKRRFLFHKASKKKEDGQQSSTQEAVDGVTGDLHETKLNDP